MNTYRSSAHVEGIVRVHYSRSTRARANSTCLFAYFLILLTMLAGFPQPMRAYSFLTHDDLIDVAWSGSIRPLLLARFPTATDGQLRAARSYAYGGATIQDMGYYPFGHQFFSNLTHYVRSGAFIDNLLRDSQTVNEYAFAIGALSHYVGDTDGHRYATNLSTPIEFPPLGKKYGPIVTYDQAPDAHVRTEFAYDVEQLSQSRFAPPGYMNLVGFYVPRRLLEQAFFETYGLHLRRVLGRPVPAIQSYRSSVKGLLPKVARAEVLIHHNDFPATKIRLRSINLSIVNRGPRSTIIGKDSAASRDLKCASSRSSSASCRRSGQFPVLPFAGPTRKRIAGISRA